MLGDEWTKLNVCQSADLSLSDIKSKVEKEGRIPGDEWTEPNVCQPADPSLPNVKSKIKTCRIREDER